MVKVLRGLGFPPALVGAARGALEAGAMAGLIFLADFFASADLDSLQWIAPIAIFGIRQLEGIVDHIDSGTTRKPAA